MEKFCPKCGKTIQEGTFCRDCEEPTLTYKEMKVKLCPSKRAFYQGTWSKYDDLHALTQKIVENKVKDDVDLVRGLEAYPKIEQHTGLKEDKDIIIRKGRYEYKLPISVEVTLSPKVSKIGNNYYEGILQVRNTRKEITEYIKDYVLDKEKAIVINNIVEDGDNADFYFADKSNIRPMAQKLRRKYGGYIKENAKLHSRDMQESTETYRYTSIIHFPTFKEGDIIEKDGEIYKVTSLGKLISAKNIRKGKKTSFKYEEDSNIEVKEVKETQVSQDRPHLEVLHPETYQSIDVENPFNLHPKPGQSVNIVMHDEKPYLVT